jgi:hypothetical protein
MTMAKSNKKLVTGKDRDGKTQTVAIIKPSPKHTRESQKIYNRTFRDALESGALLRARLGDYMEEQGLWNEAKQKEYDKVLTQILDDEKRLKKGGIKLSEAKQIAFTMADRRSDLRELLTEKTIMDSNTAEGQSDNSRFNYLMACCVVNPETGEPLFTDDDGEPCVNAYEEASDNEYIVSAAGKFAEMVYGLDDNYESKLSENEFLRKFDFMNDDLQLVNKQGQAIDKKGRLINKDGRFIDEDGNFIDIDGNQVDEDGEYMFEEEPFLDDDGKEVAVKETVKKKKVTKKKTEEASAS